MIGKNHALWEVVDNWNRCYKHNRLSLFYREGEEESQLHENEESTFSTSETTKTLNKRTRVLREDEDDLRPIHKVMGMRARRFSLNENNVNPIDLDGPNFWQESHRLRFQNMESKQFKKRLLGEEIQIQVQKDPNYFEKLKHRFATQEKKKQNSSFDSFLKLEMERLLSVAMKRHKSLRSSFAFLGQYMYDEQDVVRMTRNAKQARRKLSQQDVSFQVWKREKFEELVMRVFKQNPQVEQVLNDPFDLGLEVQFDPLSAFQYDPLNMTKQED